MDNPRNKGHFKQFCKYVHDINAVGRTKFGHCKECRSQYYIINKKFIAEKCKKFRQTHPKEMIKRRKRSRRFYKNNRYRILKEKKQYVKMHREEINAKRVSKKLIDINFKLSCNLQARISYAIKNNQQKGSAVKDLGCSVEFFRRYIESKFYANMSWKNWGKIWQLDHVKPLNSFDLTNRKQLLKAVHYTNLQPLAIRDHKQKTAKEIKQRFRLKMVRL